MAEGDSILRIARRIGDQLVGEQVRVRTPARRRPDGLPTREIDGMVLERAESRGKHLILHFQNGLVLHSHLGMRGGWHVYARGERWRRPALQAWIALSTERVEAVNFGGSTMRIAREAQLRRDPRLAHLGPDLLAGDFDTAGAIQRIRGVGAGAELGDALLDQSLVAGIGNIFKSEGCFAAGIDPRARLGEVDDDQLASVLELTREMMLTAVETGRQPGEVYRKTGRPCPRCGAPIRSVAQGDAARVSYWCPSCQPRG